MLRQILDQKAIHHRMKITDPKCHTRFLGNKVCSIFWMFPNVFLICFLIRDVVCSVYYLMLYRIINVISCYIVLCYSLFSTHWSCRPWLSVMKHATGRNLKRFVFIHNFTCFTLCSTWPDQWTAYMLLVNGFTILFHNMRQLVFAYCCVLESKEILCTFI